MLDLRTLDAGATSKPRVLIPREITLNVSYSAPDGEQYHSALVCRVPDGEGRALVDRRSAILAGVPWQNLSEYAQIRFMALALVSVHLIDLPDWVNQWIQEDDEFLFTLREEVERHSLAWFRAGLGEGGADTEAPRVSISSSHTYTPELENERA